MVHLLLAIIYISFISLGLPDGLLGSAWPSMYESLDVPMSFAGIISVIICVGTITSSLLSDRLTCRLGAGKVTAVSVAMTAVALLGFAFSDRFWMLCLWAIPYGLGAGSVDAALNNYVALHYSSRHMSWLHCMWGVGASVGPQIMGLILTLGGGWDSGYAAVAIAQLILSAILFLSLPIWKQRTAAGSDAAPVPVPLKRALAIPGAKQVMSTFFCYCALEQTAGLWAASYLSLGAGLSQETAASLGGLFFMGMTAGRFLSGFVTMKLDDTSMVRLGLGIVAAGVVVLLLPLGPVGAFTGLLLIGLGCAPVYPCLMHATPANFGEENSQALMGIQTASAYVGTALMPPLFGLIAQHISIHLLAPYLTVLLLIMFLCNEWLNRLTNNNTVH
ncbi:MAG: MFS transporter [Oscillospiraceae bacterium]|nr:MFS transporter [Oscillospiraceae bacterium]